MCELFCLQITKKLAGFERGAAAWCTNVGNERGEVLQCVLTTGEGEALLPMAQVNNFLGVESAAAVVVVVVAVVVVVMD